MQCAEYSSLNIHGYATLAHPFAVGHQTKELAMVVETRFLPLTDVAEMLSISTAGARALVRSGELRAIKVGGRGQWRVEKAEIEHYIQRMYAQTQQEIEAGTDV